MPECKHPTCGDTCRREKKKKKIYFLRRKTPIKKSPSKKSKEEIKHKEELDAFFKKMQEKLEPICANCGAYAPWIKFPAYDFLWRSSMAHVLPKRDFKSIDTNEDNIMVMFPSYSGVCDCHTNYDNSWLQASKMNIWPVVVRRFKILYPLIDPKEYQFIPEVLEEYVK